MENNVNKIVRRLAISASSGEFFLRVIANLNKNIITGQVYIKTVMDITITLKSGLDLSIVGAREGLYVTPTIRNSIQSKSAMTYFLIVFICCIITQQYLGSILLCINTNEPKGDFSF